MVKEIRWTQESVDTFEGVIEYLEQEWTDSEVSGFIQSTERVLAYISEYPMMFRKTNKKNVREALVTSHNLLVYKVYPMHITLITFWDTRQQSKTKKK